MPHVVYPANLAKASAAGGAIAPVRYLCRAEMLLLLVLADVMAWGLLAGRGSAQIVPDETLGGERSLVSPDVRIRGGKGDRIDGGAARENLLFHSFEAFNVNTGQRVYFANPSGIDTILSRVTGNEVSEILGILGVEGGADLFLLNPNGIVFGTDAQLDIAGSFLATTADGFTLGDGLVFSAVAPDAAPLLTVNVTPGLQWGQQSTPYQGMIWGGVIQNSGNLSVGESLTLAGHTLDLTGRLDAGHDLTLQGLEAVAIRDSGTVPFIASAGQQVQVQGDRALNISALSHPDSELVAGQDIVLRSSRPVVGDSHFEAGRSFRVERLHGGLGRFLSVDDPVIRTDGDVRFRDYTGASLHVLAGGSVTIPGPITITGADTTENSLQESVTLSDGETVVEIDGGGEPTLDIRAGLRLRSASDGTGGRAGIRLGDVTNPGGLVFLTNQYRPNQELTGGDIEVGAIDTSVVEPVNGVSRGGDVVIDSRGSIEITGNVTTFAHAGFFELDEFGFVNPFLNTDLDFAGNVVRVNGGDITLYSGNNITTQNLDTSVVAAAKGEETRRLQPDGTERVETGDANTIAQGGKVTFITQVDLREQPITASVGNIETSDINTSSHVLISTAADASVDVSVGGTRLIEAINTEDAGIAIAGNVTGRSQGGDIHLSTHVNAKDIAVESRVGTVTIGSLNSSAFSRSNAHADASVNVQTFVDYSVRDSTSTFAENNGDGGTAISGIIRNFRNQGGTISLASNVVVGEIAAASDVGILDVTQIDTAAQTSVSIGALAEATANGLYDYSYTYDNSIAENHGNGGMAIGGKISNFSNLAGNVNLDTYVNASDILDVSNIGTLQGGSIYSYATLDVFARSTANAGSHTRNTGNAGTAIGSNINNFRTKGGNINLSTRINAGDILASSNVGILRTPLLSSDASDVTLCERFGFVRDGTTVFAGTDAHVTAYENTGMAGIAHGGIINTFNHRGGNIQLSTTVSTGDIDAASVIGNIETTGPIFSAAVIQLVSNTANASIKSPKSDLMRGGEAVGGSIRNLRNQGGDISFSSEIYTGNISAASDVGNLRIATIGNRRIPPINSFSEARTDSSSNYGDGWSENAVLGGKIKKIRNQAGNVILSADISTGNISDSSDIGRIYETSIDASVDTEIDAFARSGPDYSVYLDESSDGRVKNNESGQMSIGGQIVDFHSLGGDVLIASNVLTGNITEISDIATIGIENIYSYSFVEIDVESESLSSIYASAEIEENSEIGEGVNSIDVNAINSGDGGIAMGGRIRNFKNRGGDITVSAIVNSGNIDASSDIGTLQINKIDSSALSDRIFMSAYSSANTYTGASIDTDFNENSTSQNRYFIDARSRNTGNGGAVEGGSLENFQNLSGEILLSTSSNIGRITETSNIATIQTQDLVSFAFARPAVGAIAEAKASVSTDTDFPYSSSISRSENRGNAGTAMGGNIRNLENRSGDITISADINTGDILASAHIGTLTVSNVNSSAFSLFFTDTNASANSNSQNYIFPPSRSAIELSTNASNQGDGGNAIGGVTENIRSRSGNISIFTNVLTGNIMNLSDIGIIQTKRIEAYSDIDLDISANAEANAIAENDRFSGDSGHIMLENSGNGGVATGGVLNNISSQGGSVSLRSTVNGGTITLGSNLGIIQVRKIDSSADVLADASVSTSVNGGTGSGGQATAQTANATAIGGDILLVTQTSHDGSLSNTSDIGTIYSDAKIESGARAFASTNVEGEDVDVGAAQFSAQGGTIRFNSTGQIQLNRTSVLNAEASLSERFDEESQVNVQDEVNLSGGDIFLIADDAITLNQISAETNAKLEFQDPTGALEVIVADVLASSAGNVIVHTPSRITLRDNASISGESIGQDGRAGNIVLSSQSLILGEQSQISSQTDSGNGGNITLNSREQLVMGRNSLISTEAGTTQSGGDGGNININARFITTFPQGNSDIVANAFEGDGGNIDITTNGLFGIAFRDQQTSLSDITASSELGSSGIIAINNPETNPAEGVVELPGALVDVARLVNQSLCRVTQRSEFIMTGQGGVMPSPHEQFRSNDLWEDWRLTDLSESPTNNSSTDLSAIALPLSLTTDLNALTSTQAPSSLPPVEAQGWHLTSDGEITLVAAVSEWSDRPSAVNPIISPSSPCQQ